jgi:splicing factor 45
MTAPPPPPPPRGGLSLYDDLLDPSDASQAATISSAPVLYNQNDAPADQAAKKPVDPALRFQPIRRPQVKQPKPKSTFPKAVPKPPVTPAVPAAPSAPPKNTLADWAATEEDEWLYGIGEKRQRGGRRNKKKKHHIHAETDWDEMYDPSRPTNVEEYMRSDEKIDEVREWKALLYRHRKKSDESDFSDEDDQPRHIPSSMERDSHITIFRLTKPLQINSLLRLRTLSRRLPNLHLLYRLMRAPTMHTLVA